MQYHRKHTKIKMPLKIWIWQVSIIFDVYPVNRDLECSNISVVVASLITAPIGTITAWTNRGSAASSQYESLPDGWVLGPVWWRNYPGTINVGWRENTQSEWRKTFPSWRWCLWSAQDGEWPTSRSPAPCQRQWTSARTQCTMGLDGGFFEVCCVNT